MLIEKLKTKIKEARLAKNKQFLLFYTTLLGDCENARKTTQDPITDDLIIKVGNSWLKAYEEMLLRLRERPCETTLEKTKEEAKLLRELLPQRLTEAQLKETIQYYIETGEDNLGKIMKRLKTEQNGRYSGAEASKLIKEMLDVR